MKRILFVTLLCMVVEVARAEEKREPAAFEVELEVTSLVVGRNDGDFDRTAPLYNEFGQSEAFIATFLHPFIKARALDHLLFFYETEIGMDLWSEKNPDHWLGVTGSSPLSMKQRQIYAQVEWRNWFLRTGYQRLTDSSGLFINHWLGALRAGYGLEDHSRVRVTLAQMPDQTHEGWSWGQTFGNFNSDVLLAALEGYWHRGDHLVVDGGGYYLFDGTVARQERHLGAAAATVALRWPDWGTSLSLISQFGVRRNGGAGGDDTGIFGWAAEWRGRVTLGMVTLAAAATALSADDVSQGNDSLGFVWSGKRASQSLLLSENEVRDIGDNIDERMALFDGFFWESRAGLGAADLGVTVQPLPWLRLGAVTEGLMVLNPDQVLGHRFAGWENSLSVDYTLFQERLRIHAAGGLLLPGGAAAARLNYIDREATDALYFGQGAVMMHF